jgi:DNA-binding NtrC family response regulator
MSGGKRLFLVVDDEPEICWILERILQRAGGSCQIATDAHTALSLTQRMTFDIAFLDAKLPDRDGLDLARELLGNDPGMRIVIVSGYFYRDDPTITAAIQSGLITAFFAKPFDHDEILRTIGFASASPDRRERTPFN